MEWTEENAQMRFREIEMNEMLDFQTIELKYLKEEYKKRRNEIDNLKASFEKTREMFEMTKIRVEHNEKDINLLIAKDKQREKLNS